MKKLALLMAIGSFSALTFAQSTATTISLSGFNQDVIAETVNGGTFDGDAATVQAETSTTLDSAYVFFQNNFDYNYPGVGLPDSGSFTSQTSAQTPFQLASYTANNVLLLAKSGQSSVAPMTGSLTLNTAASYSSLAFLVDGFNGTQSASYTLNFADGSSEGGTFSALDNFTTFDPSTALGGIGRISRLDGYAQVDGFDPSLYEVDVNVTNSTKVIDSISFTNTSTSGGGYNTLGVFAISGVQTQAAPEPMMLIALGAGLLAVLALRRK